MKGTTVIAVVNVSILVTIATLSLTGFWVLGTADGLWSLLLLFGWLSHRDKDDAAE